MEFFVNKIVDHPVVSKINLEKINQLLASKELPNSFRGVNKWAVTFVAREPNDYVFDAWRENGKIYLTIPLVYVKVLTEMEEEITRRCGELFDHYVKLLQGFGADQNPAS